MTHKDYIEHIEVLKHKPVLSKKEYGILTGLSIPTITRLAISGEIPSMKVGRSRLLVNNLTENN